MNHELKTDPEQFDAVRVGSKTFEIRFDDRTFMEGDKLILKKTVYTGEEMEAGSPLMYNGERMEVKVTHVLRGPIDGLRSGWVIMSIETPEVRSIKGLVGRLQSGIKNQTATIEAKDAKGAK